MGQSRKDKTWGRLRHTRHVWVRQAGVQQPPLQGYIVEWRRHSYRWSALVVVTIVYPDGSVSTNQQWLAAESLVPVRSNPDSSTGRIPYPH